MAKLIYASNMSLDGCTEDERGGFDWAPPDDDVFVFITELMRSAGTYLYGRRMYETLAVWETDATRANQSDLMADYASAWQAAGSRSDRTGGIAACPVQGHSASRPSRHAMCPESSLRPERPHRRCARAGHTTTPGHCNEAQPSAGGRFIRPGGHAQASTPLR